MAVAVTAVVVVSTAAAVDFMAAGWAAFMAAAWVAITGWYGRLSRRRHGGYHGVGHERLSRRMPVVTAAWVVAV